MNRAERRRQEKEQGKKKAVYQFTEEQLQDMLNGKINDVKRELTESVVNRVMGDYLTITLMTLYDKFDFSKEQLIDFKKKMDDLSDCITDDYVTIEELRLCMIDELEINLLGVQGDKSTEVRFEKVNKYKKCVFNSGVWFTYVSFMKHLREKLKVGAKRGLDLTERVFVDIVNYVSDKASFMQDLQKFVDTKGNEDMYMTAFDYLRESDILVNGVEIKKAIKIEIEGEEDVRENTEEVETTL